MILSSLASDLQPAPIRIPPLYPRCAVRSVGPLVPSAFLTQLRSLHPSADLTPALPLPILSFRFLQVHLLLLVGSTPS